MTPQKNTSVKGKCSYPNLRWPHENKMSAMKKYFTIISYTLCTKHVMFYLPLTISVSVSIFTVSAFIFLTFTPLHCHSTTYHHSSHPLHWIYNTSYNPSQSFLVRCAAMLLWSTLTKYSVYISWFINLIETVKIQFSPQNLNTCVLDFCVVSVVWSVWVCLFLWYLICGLVQVCFLSHVVNS